MAGVRVYFMVNPNEASPERSRDFPNGARWSVNDGILTVYTDYTQTIAAIPIQNVRYIEHTVDGQPKPAKPEPVVVAKCTEPGTVITGLVGVRVEFKNGGSARFHDADTYEWLEHLLLVSSRSKNIGYMSIHRAEVSEVRELHKAA